MSTPVSKSTKIPLSDQILNISVIIPLAPREVIWPALLEQLAELNYPFEIVFASPEERPFDFERLKAQYEHLYLHWLKTQKGRAKQMNRAAQLSSGEYLWFLHADSQLSEDCFQNLEKNLRQKPLALHYCRLNFKKDGPYWMFVNNMGVWFRSECLKIPFGDQGFCVGKSLFIHLQGFNETTLLGEDHDFVWKARQAGIKLSCTKSILYTSARKYAEKGWLKTTLWHMYKTAQLALPKGFKRLGIGR